MPAAEDHAPSVFVSYSHDDALIADALAGFLTEAGCTVWIDRSGMRVGDSMVEAIGGAIHAVDFFLALVSAASLQSSWCERELALGLTGEIEGRVGRVLPVRIGNAAMPPAVADKKYVHVRGPDDIPGAAAELLAAIAPTSEPSQQAEANVPPSSGGDVNAPITMVGIVKEGVTVPLEDGTPGSSLYRIPIRLSRRPDARWAQLLIELWDSPSAFSMMHRPGIASVVGDTVVLDGTTLDELERVHMATLRWAVQETNVRRAAEMGAARLAREGEERRRREHAAQVDEAERRIDFG